ncbi:MAG: nicotinate (nicotinamide) nucleotide adenylyltransferase [Ignavibacteriae bacterium]|nr:nicotinate (nicotinamide) nucleotide adenylyltransferase [Ignavibacteriota bacterium]NOG98729.1 nicotinate (nicotinamide) nucleotide adenylyltransferase [Ignavibacteriota bacterium]
MIGILGGTFDPIHTGHLITARVVLETRGYEKIVLIPCSISPHKQGVKTADNYDRLNMVKAAIANDALFEVSDYELMMGGISYTIDTLKHFMDTYNKIELIIGYDNLAKFDTWKNYKEILDLTNLIVMKRSTDNIAVENKTVLEKAIIVDTPTIEISSSSIRERIKNHLPIDNLVPDAVKKYIYDNGIYSDNN